MLSGSRTSIDGWNGLHWIRKISGCMLQGERSGKKSIAYMNVDALKELLKEREVMV